MCSLPVPVCVCVRLQQGKYDQRAAPGAAAQVTGNLFTSRRAADEHPACVCVRHKEVFGGTQSPSSPK